MYLLDDSILIVFERFPWSPLKNDVYISQAFKFLSQEINPDILSLNYDCVLVKLQNIVNLLYSLIENI